MVFADRPELDRKDRRDSLMVSQLSTRTLDQINSSSLRRLSQYWHSKTAPGQPLPYRKDIDAVDLRDLLPIISISDVEYEPLRFRYRLVGTRVVEYNHQEFTGKYLGEVGWVGESLLLSAYVEAVTRQRPNYGVYAWELITGGKGRCEFAIFPLVNDSGHIHQVIAAEDYEFPAREVDPTRV